MKNGVLTISDAFSVVAIGDFNPAIFQPHWLARNNLIRDEEAEKTEVKLITAEVAILEGPWFLLQVTKGRFAIDSLDPVQNMALRDMVIGIFNILEHTPMRGVGLNSVGKFQFPDELTWHQFGDHFSPKVTWEEVMHDPGLLELTVAGSANFGGEDIPVRVEIQSLKDYRVQVSVNHHFGFNEKYPPADCTAGKRIDTISRCYQDFFKHSEKIKTTLFSKFSNTPKRQ